MTAFTSTPSKSSRRPRGPVAPVSSLPINDDDTADNASSPDAAAQTPASQPSKRTATSDAAHTETRNPPEKQTAPQPSAGGKLLVVLQDGAVTFADDAVHVVDLDAAGSTGDPHRIVDTIAALKDAVPEKAGRAEAVDALFEILRARV